MNGRPPERTRRSLLRAGALVGAGLLAGCSAPAAPATEETVSEAPDSGTDTATGDGTDPGEKRVSIPADAGWYSFGGGVGNPGSHADGDGPRGEPSVAWRVNVDGIYTMPGPVVADGTAYVGSGKKGYAVDAVTGERRWTATFDELTHHFSPAIADDTVYFGAQGSAGINSGGNEGTLAAFSTAGESVWSATTHVTTSPKPVGDRVFFGESADTGYVTAVGAADGEQLWRTPVGTDLVRGSPAVGEDRVVVTASAADDSGGRIVAVHPDTGELAWTKRLDAPVRGAPAIRDGDVFVTTNSGEIRSHGLADGRRNWVRDTDAKGGTAPAVTSDRVIALVENTLTALDRGSGAVEWSTDIGYTIINGVSVIDGVAYVGGSRLTGVDVASGEMLLDHPVPGTGGGFGAPVVVGNALFVGVCIKKDSTDAYNDFFYAYV